MKSIMKPMICAVFFFLATVFPAIADDGEPWGLIQETASGAEKIPLILVHGDNSFNEKEDRWGFFLDWIDDHPEFTDRYEIWRFHHDTRKLIGYDGRTGNALELGDAITAQFGPDRPILILAHSRGGLVSRSYMNRYGDGEEGDRVLGLITLATPHHGSPGAVPDWGLLSVKGKFQDTELADVLYDYSADAVVNVASQGTMGLAWDNFDGPEYGMGYTVYDISSPLGNNHYLSIMDANVEFPVLEPGQEDPTQYLPDRAYGTLEGLNADERYYGRIIAYGGYITDLGLGGQDPFNWLDLSFGSHAGLEMSVHLMANIPSRSDDGEVYHYAANDGMVPLQSAFLLKKDSANEPPYNLEEDTDFFVVDTLEVEIKDLSPRLSVRKSVLCPKFDHLHMVEGKGGLLDDRADYWQQVADDLNYLAGLGDAERIDFTPTMQTFEPSSPTVSDVSSGENCFIQSAAGGRGLSLWLALIGIAALVGAGVKSREV